MDAEGALNTLRGGDAGAIERVLREYSEEHRATFKFDPADEEKRKKLCEGIFKVLEKDITTSCQVTCLEVLRILSRDKKVLVPVTTKENMQILMRLAKLDDSEASLEEVADFPVIVESLKCLCNIVFNSQMAQKLSLELNLAAMLCNLLRKCKDQQVISDIKCFDLRLLFLLSLLHTDIRSQLRYELQGLPLLTQALESAFSIKWTDEYEAAIDHNGPPLSPQETDCAIEALKALFNVTVDSWNVHSESDSHQFRVMAAVLRHCLLTMGPTEDKTEELHSNAVNLLSNVPVSCLDVLISPLAQDEIAQEATTLDEPTQEAETGQDETREEEANLKYNTMVYNGMNMEAIRVLLDFMEKRIDKGSCYREGLTPVLSLLTECSRAHRNIRKFIKDQVLPPLRDVTNRPEVGTTVRNKLVRLMTHVDLGVKQIAAEFLFVLCKERVDSLLKYTGYGNAAGLLAARGLLAGGRGDHWYSDDEDTDTEEYKSAKPNINLITGHLEEPMPNPIDEMTEEQKEYEAMKLVNMLDKLSRCSLHYITLDSDGLERR